MEAAIHINFNTLRGVGVYYTYIYISVGERFFLSFFNGSVEERTPTWGGEFSVLASLPSNLRELNMIHLKQGFSLAMIFLYNSQYKKKSNIIFLDFLKRKRRKLHFLFCFHFFFASLRMIKSIGVFLENFCQQNPCAEKKYSGI